MKLVLFGKQIKDMLRSISHNILRFIICKCQEMSLTICAIHLTGRNANKSHHSFVGFGTFVNSSRDYENNKRNSLYRLSLHWSREGSLKLSRYWIAVFVWYEKGDLVENLFRVSRLGVIRHNHPALKAITETYSCYAFKYTELSFKPFTLHSQQVMMNIYRHGCGCITHYYSPVLSPWGNANCPLICLFVPSVSIFQE